MAIGVVVVTYNRIDKLKRALHLFSAQTVKPDYVVVVNNASTDATPFFLKKWRKIDCGYSKYVINLTKNIGGSGGFHTGLKFASKLSSNWIWVSDDDAFPAIDAIEKAQKYLDPNLSAICGEVINNGKIDLSHRRNYKLGKFRVLSQNLPESEYYNDEFEITCFSYVGAVINKAKLEKIGLPRKEYFIWYDDTEHSLRLNKVGKIMCVPAVKIYHNVGMGNNKLSWKTYYGIRNRADLIKRNFPKKYYKNYCCINLTKAFINKILGNHEKAKLLKNAILDSKSDNLGINNVYKPGWKPNMSK